MNTLDVLINTRNLIENPETWGSGGTAFMRGTLCLSQAIDKAANHNHDLWAGAFQAVKDHLGTSVIAWNDEPGRKHSEVLDLLDHIIETEREATALADRVAQVVREYA